MFEIVVPSEKWTVPLSATDRFVLCGLTFTFGRVCNIQELALLLLVRPFRMTMLLCGVYTPKRCPKQDWFHAAKGVVVLSQFYSCLLYTSDAADDLLCVDLGGRR